MTSIAGGQLGQLAAAPQAGAGGDLLSSVFIAVGVMILVWFLLRMQWRRQGRARSDGPAEPARAGRGKTPLEHLESLSSGRQPDREEEAAGAQLVQLGRRVLAQIEARSAQLEALIDDADARIEELRRLEHTAARADAEDHGAGARRGGAEAHNGRHLENPAAPDRAAEDPVTRGVYELADRGLAPVEIARELDQHLGAVELILALRPK